MKGIGAAYLAWMGFQAFRSKASGASSSENTRKSEARGGMSDVWRGFIVAVMNPKVVIFFLAYLPQFVRPEYGAPTKQLLVLGLTFCISATTVNSGVAFMSGKVAQWLREKHQKTMNRICGGVMLGLAGRLLWR
jgi:threonine/homoserine/homoserine lactone efflux protein